MLRRKRLYAVDHEKYLGVNRLLSPECAIVVESSDALLRRHIIRAAFVGHPPYKFDDGFLCCAVVPGGQSVGSPSLRLTSEAQPQKKQDKQCAVAFHLQSGISRTPLFLFSQKHHFIGLIHGGLVIKSAQSIFFFVVIKRVG